MESSKTEHFGPKKFGPWAGLPCFLTLVLGVKLYNGIIKVCVRTPHTYDGCMRHPAADYYCDYDDDYY